MASYARLARDGDRIRQEIEEQLREAVETNLRELKAARPEDKNVILNHLIVACGRLNDFILHGRPKVRAIKKKL